MAPLRVRLSRKPGIGIAGSILRKIGIPIDDIRRDFPLDYFPEDCHSIILHNPAVICKELFEEF